MRRFYFPEIPDSKEFFLPEDESKHIVRVLRMKIGDEVLLLNGSGLKAKVQLKDENPKKCLVEVVQLESICRRQKGFHLAIAPTKNADRIEWMLEKIVEVGAEELTFIISDRSEKATIKMERLERVAISAMKQAEHDFKIHINSPVKFKDFISQNPNGRIAHCLESEDKKNTSDCVNSGPTLIGPEGDFTPAEIKFALENGYEALQLGEARLRTETAGLVAVVLGIHCNLVP